MLELDIYEQFSFKVSFDTEIFSPHAKSSEVGRRELPSYRVSCRMEHPNQYRWPFHLFNDGKMNSDRQRQRKVLLDIFGLSCLIQPPGRD